MQAQEQFVRSGRTHVLMMTNHGVHEWNVTPGMPDTGGQNVYVNQFTEALVAQGYRVTITNRGGYPHPRTGRMQTGVHYHPSGMARIIYLEDGRPEFVRKEDMAEQIPALVDDLARRLEEQQDSYDLIISHYWDAGVLGMMLSRRTARTVPHIWIPHSLGALKKQNMDPSTWGNLRIDERIEHERELIRHIDGAVATSSAIRETFIRDYDHTPKYFLPPCVNVDRYHPRDPSACEDIWDFLAGHSSLSAAQLQQRKFITEISRTDRTKRKDILIRAFAHVKERVPEALLAVSIDPGAGPLYVSLLALIEELGLHDDVIVLGSVWDQLPYLYSITSVYCTPSVMEGFGMSAQEAAATGRPVVASELVPFAREHLLGSDPMRISVNRHGPAYDLLFGQGGVVVPADFVAGFAEANARLLQDDDLRERMGAGALEITVPYFTWDRRTRDLLDDLGVTPTRESRRG
jgi:glycosyltransferase involved in cell wall biosynthesis